MVLIQEILEFQQDLKIWAKNRRERELVAAGRRKWEGWERDTARLGITLGSAPVETAPT